MAVTTSRIWLCDLCRRSLEETIFTGLVLLPVTVSDLDSSWLRKFVIVSVLADHCESFEVNESICIIEFVAGTSMSSVRQLRHRCTAE